MLTAYVIPELGMRQLSRLSPMDVQEMVNALNGRGLSPRTVRYAVTVLRQALRQAVRWRLLANNPVEAGDVTLPKQVRKERRVLSRAEVERLLKAAEGSRLEALWRLAIATAMRPGEYLALKWEDVDFDAGRVAVKRTLQPGGRFAECKTARSRRTITLPPSILRALREHKARQNEERLALGAEYQDQGPDLLHALREAARSQQPRPLPLRTAPRAGGTPAHPPLRPAAHGRDPAPGGRR